MEIVGQIESCRNEIAAPLTTGARFDNSVVLRAWVRSSHLHMGTLTKRSALRGQARYTRGVTYSIVARDPATGELGVAVASCMFAVGSLVPWARAGVGAVATQALGEVVYGPRCLALLAAGAGTEAVLAEVRAADGLSALCQVAVIDASGAVASFTGDLCIDHAGHRVGDGYGVQANMMASDRVWPAMADAFETSSEPLGARMLAAFGAYGCAVEAFVDGRPDDSLSLIDQALCALPGEANFAFLRGVALAAAGRGEAAADALRALLAANPSWSTVARSFAAKGLIALPPEMDLDALLGDS